MNFHGDIDVLLSQPTTSPMLIGVQLKQKLNNRPISRQTGAGKLHHIAPEKNSQTIVIYKHYRAAPW